MHDRDWVFAPLGERPFKRLEVTAGDMLPGNMQEIVSGIKPGDQVVRECAGDAEHGGAIDDPATSSILLSTRSCWSLPSLCC